MVISISKKKSDVYFQIEDTDSMFRKISWSENAITTLKHLVRENIWGERIKLIQT